MVRCVRGTTGVRRMRVRTGADEASVVGILAEGAADGGHAEGGLRRRRFHVASFCSGVRDAAVVSRTDAERF